MAAVATLLTQGGKDWEDAGAGAFTTASITPGANCVLVLLVGGISWQNGFTGTLFPTTPTSSGSGPTWTQRSAQNQAAPFTVAGAVYTAQITGTDPGSFTVTLDFISGADPVIHFYALYKVTGHDTATPFGGKVTTANQVGNGALTVTLDAAPASGDITLALCHTDGDAGGGSGNKGATFGSGWTEDWDGAANADGLTFPHNAGQRTGSTSTSVSWTDVNASTAENYSSGQAAIVVKAAGGSATNASAGVATATATAQTPSKTVAPVAGVAQATASARTPGIGTTAGVAQATATARTPATSIATTGGAGSATGSGQNPAPSIKPTAGVATATATARTPGVALAPTAGSASGTGSGSGPAPSVAPTAGVATATAAAQNPTVSTTAGTNATAGTASATATANNPSVAIAPTAGAAAATAAGQTPQESGSSALGSSSATATALAPSVSIAAKPGVAQATATAQTPSVTVGTKPGAAAATASALTPASALSSAIGGASASGSGSTPAPSVAPVAGCAQATATAYNPIINTSGQTNAQAALAEALATAYDPQVSIAALIGLAVATATANGPAISTAAAAARPRGQSRVRSPRGWKDRPHRTVRTNYPEPILEAAEAAVELLEQIAEPVVIEKVWEPFRWPDVSSEETILLLL